MSRNFELMTQLGLQVGVTDKPRPDAADRAVAMDVSPIRSSDAGNASEEEMARFILEMFPHSGCASKE
jgi:hypothetical protein